MTPKQKNLAMRIEAERMDRRNISLGWQTSGAQADYVRGLMIRKAVAEVSEALLEVWAQKTRYVSYRASHGASSKPAPVDPYAELKAAQDAGKVIEIQCGITKEWCAAYRPHFILPPVRYRIKPD